MSAAAESPAAAVAADADAAPAAPDRLLRLAAVLALVGLGCVLIFLMFGFLPWTVGVGLFLGIPVLGVAMLIYLYVVVRNLKQHGQL